MHHNNVHPIRPGVRPAGISSTTELANALADARQSANNWQLAFFAMTALAGYQWYKSSGMRHLKRVLGAL